MLSWQNIYLQVDNHRHASGAADQFIGSKSFPGSKITASEFEGGQKSTMDMGIWNLILPKNWRNVAPENGPTIHF